MFDELAQQYFNSPEEFAAALKLLQRCKAAEQQYTNFEDFEANFLDNLDDVTGCDTRLLNKAIDYESAKSVGSGTTTPVSSASETKILEAIKNQHREELTPIPIQQAFDGFISERKENWKDGNNERHYRQDIFALFYELVGDIQTTDLKKDHAKQYKKAVLKIPANRNKRKKYRNLTVSQLMDANIPDDDKFSTRNKEKYLQHLSGFLQWLQKEDHAIDGIHTPLQGVIKKDSVEHEERNPYSCDDLRDLFNSKQYTRGLHTHAFMFWVPLIGLFTGARENEICQLYVTDIYQYEDTNTWVFDINEDGKKKTQKSLKKSEHARLVPIHPKLISLGFLDFCASMKEKHERLFPELPHRGKNKYADKLQRWFNRTYTNQANCNIESENTSFHSFRHTLITYLSNKLDMPPHKIAMMMGQKPDGGVTVVRYIKPIELKDRYDYLKKVNFKDCIDFDLIKPWNHHKFAK